MATSVRCRRRHPGGPGRRPWGKPPLENALVLTEGAVEKHIASIFAAALVPMTMGTASAAQAVPQGAAPVPALDWTACDGGFQCATARVPLDYRHPRGTVISIAVIRHLATDPARQLGTLFVNLGGPMEQIEPVTYADLLTAIPLGTVGQWQGSAVLLQQLWADATSPSGAAPSSTAHPSGAVRAASLATGNASGDVYTGLDQTYAVICTDNADPRSVSDYTAAARLAEGRAGGWGLYWATR